MKDDIAHAVRRTLVARSAAVLIVDDLRPEDLGLLHWSGSPTHVRHVAAALGRVAAGEAEYLAVRAASGEPIAIGGINYWKRDDAGTLWQLVTHPELRGLGIGTHLIWEAEARIRAHQRPWAQLAVEVNNPRARSLYERLGYEPFAKESDSWEQETADGRVELYETTVVLLQKRL